MARTLQQAIDDLNATQNLYDRTIMEIGQLYADLNWTKDERLHKRLNEKFDMLVKVEQRKKEIEKEISSLGG